MANFCDFEFRVKGRKTAVEAFFESTPYLDWKDIEYENGTDSTYEMYFKGNCKWSINFDVEDDCEGVSADLANESGSEYIGYSVRAKSDIFKCEVKVHYWSMESEFDQFDHYKNGECLKKRKIAFDNYDNAENFDWVTLEFIDHEGEYDTSVIGEQRDAELMDMLRMMPGAEVPSQKPLKKAKKKEVNTLNMQDSWSIEQEIDLRHQVFSKATFKELAEIAKENFLRAGLIYQLAGLNVTGVLSITQICGQIATSHGREPNSDEKELFSATVGDAVPSMLHQVFWRGFQNPFDAESADVIKEHICSAPQLASSILDIAFCFMYADGRVEPKDTEYINKLKSILSNSLKSGASIYPAPVDYASYVKAADKNSILTKSKFSEDVKKVSANTSSGENTSKPTSFSDGYKVGRSPSSNRVNDESARAYNEKDIKKAIEGVFAHSDSIYIKTDLIEKAGLRYVNPYLVDNVITDMLNSGMLFQRATGGKIYLGSQESKYQKLRRQFDDAMTPAALKEVALLFRPIDGYKDSRDYWMKTSTKKKELLSQKIQRMFNANVSDQDIQTMIKQLEGLKDCVDQVQELIQQCKQRRTSSNAHTVAPQVAPKAEPQAEQDPVENEILRLLRLGSKTVKEMKDESDSLKKVEDPILIFHLNRLMEKAGVSFDVVRGARHYYLPEQKQKAKIAEQKALKHSKAELQERMKDLDQRINASRSAFSTKENEWNFLKKSISDRQKAYVDIETKCNSEIERLQAKLKKLEEEKASILSSQDELKQSLAKKSHELEHSARRRAVDAFEEALQLQMREEEKAHQKAKKSLLFKKKLLDDAEQQSKETRALRDKLNVALEELKQYQAEQEAVISELRSKIEKNKAALDEIPSLIEKTMKEMESAKNQITSAKKDWDKAVSQIKKAKQDCNKEKQTLTELEAQRDKCQKDIGELDEKIRIAEE